MPRNERTSLKGGCACVSACAEKLLPDCTLGRALRGLIKGSVAPAETDSEAEREGSQVRAKTK